MKVQDVKILIGNEDYISEGQLRFHSERGKVEMVWTCDYDGHPPPKQQEKRKEKEEVRACIEAGHAAG